MLLSEATGRRKPLTVSLSADLVIVGGGLSGTCAAITAARSGIKVILATDRPVLGGNASSEVRLWVLGATSHMGNNNRWAREGGIVDELLVENTFRNPEGNPLIFDTVILEKVVQEPNITLLLNTAVYDLEKSAEDAISSVAAFCSQNSTAYTLSAPLFCDASGDGIVGFLAGAAFRMGAESTEEFGELFAPTKEYGELLGHSMYFYTKDTGKPVRFVPPAFAIDVTQKIPKFQRFNAKEQGCQLWWLEYGGRLDTVHETETIKWELWKVVYGIWNYIKNSGKFPEADTMTLEWVGTIPGKRESRRFEGDFILTQQDIVEQRAHYDDIAYGGWSIDLHPADGVFSEKPGCNQWHSKGVYTIPYRCFYSKNIRNLFLAGRIISTSHVAFASSRVMATSAHGGQAVGMAAVLCHRNGLDPRHLSSSENVKQLQQHLLRIGHYIPGFILRDEQDLVQKATLSASSTLVLQELSEDTDPLPMEHSMAQMFPVKKGAMPALTVHPYAKTATELVVELKKSGKSGNYTPDVLLASKVVQLQPGRNCIRLDFGLSIADDAYVFLILRKNEQVSFRFSEMRVTGILSVFNSINEAVSNFGKQEPPENIGMDGFEFWCPQRRPGGRNLAMKIEPGIAVFTPENLRNGIQRPVNGPNAYVASFTDENPEISLSWDQPQRISRIELSFDTDFDHPMESVLMTHPESAMPFCVQEFEVRDEHGAVIFSDKANHKTRRSIVLESPVRTSELVLKLKKPAGNIPAALMEVRVYDEF
ncbi:MAG: FAD-dependent oxidoreductase [Mucilaginibacter polytrichastri]|nr:FAD-dependent oxidoreductase [Mucilaginibacter polytrichastri]